MRPEWHFNPKIVGMGRRPLSSVAGCAKFEIYLIALQNG